MREDVKCRVFSKTKEKIEKVVENLENNYLVIQPPEIRWNDEHEDYEVWLYLLHKDTLKKQEVTTNE